VANLFESVQLGSLVLANRVFMAPLTRNRADADGVPGELAATYYSQRASAGLIVTEATQISPMGKGYINTPGIHSPEQVRAWSRIVESVHKSGGRIFLQLWHVGRISHSSLVAEQRATRGSVGNPCQQSDVHCHWFCASFGAGCLGG
jgi:N-ethylmaleimide reductase